MSTKNTQMSNPPPPKKNPTITTTRGEINPMLGK